MIRALALLFFAAIGVAGQAADEPVLKTQQLAEHVFALIGPTGDRDPKNMGNNANFGVVVTEEGVILIDAGATRQGARMIHQHVQAITDQPLKVVINTGGQDHRWLGNGYFKSLGVRIIANQKAVADQKVRVHEQLSRLANRVGDAGLAGTEPVFADETFTDMTTLTLGGVRLEIHHAGHAHTPGDSFVWLPDSNIVFSGDIVYTDRMLGVGAQSAHKSWIAAFEAMAEKQPTIVVGGHGQPADLATARADSYDYLVFLRQAVGEFMDAGHGIDEISNIDQSRFRYLENYDALKGRNAQRVFEELEWE